MNRLIRIDPALNGIAIGTLVVADIAMAGIVALGMPNDCGPEMGLGFGFLLTVFLLGTPALAAIGIGTFVGVKLRRTGLGPWVLASLLIAGALVLDIVLPHTGVGSAGCRIDF